ncbi:CpaF family protein [Candidatus Micrarchaeota archaeon]|nr:CpaF family protein [Candidatus Micrarchaeota archaeon]
MYSARVEVDYPFSHYIVDEKPLSADLEYLMNDFIKLLTKKTALKDYARIYKLDEKERYFKEFLTNFDEEKIGKPLPSEEKLKMKEQVQVLYSQILADPLSQKILSQQTLSQLFGIAVLEPLFEDDELEEIMVNGPEHIYVFHRKVGMCQTNLKFKNEKHMLELLAQVLPDDRKIAVDLRLPDGSRANVLFPPAVDNTSITIRKFKQQPLTVIDLIKNNTLSLDMTAFLWVVIEGFRMHPMNILVIGETASGKTTTLNALSSFIPPSDRIVSMEDTREINLYGMDNWVATKTTDTIDLEGLVKNSLRMRPDRLIIGEVRGNEAHPLFTAMNIGHRGLMATLHAQDAHDSIQRLKNYPMNVPPNLIPLVDLAVVQHRIYTKKAGVVRRVTEIAEFGWLDNVVTQNEIFQFDLESLTAERTTLPSQTIEKLGRAIAKTSTEINNEIQQRKKLLNYLLENKVNKMDDINLFMRKYYGEIENQGK